MANPMNRRSDSVLCDPPLHIDDCLQPLWDIRTQFLQVLFGRDVLPHYLQHRLEVCTVFIHVLLYV